MSQLRQGKKTSGVDSVANTSAAYIRRLPAETESAGWIAKVVGLPQVIADWANGA